MKPVLIVGEGMPRAGSSLEPLSRQFPRLADLAGISEAEIRRKAVGVNLYPVAPAEWHSADARKRAMYVVAEEFLDGAGARRSHVILLGRRVAWAFGLEADWCSWESWSGGLLIGSIPHTSKRNRLYNDEAIRERVGSFLRGVFDDRVPATPRR